jgi:toxin ParE1/3/4
MSLRIQKSPRFLADFEAQYGWYIADASAAVAKAYLDAVHLTIEILSEHPGLDRRRRFRHPLLVGIQSFRVTTPFQKHLVFYRQSDAGLVVERIIYGARDLPRRLLESPED